MRIHLVNPNSATAITAKIAEAARAVASPGTTIVARQSANGPAAIESKHDEALAMPELLSLIRDGERERFDAHVIACFGDPGLDEARAITPAPVLGIAQAAMHAASMLGSRFSIVTTLDGTIATAEELVDRYGMRRHCRKVRATGLAVREFESTSAEVRRRVLVECRRALDEDDAEAIVLGCAGMSDLTDELARKLDVPVIDGVAAAVKFAEAVVGIGSSTPNRFPLSRIAR